MAKLYYIKWDVEEGVLILDQQKKKVSQKELLVVPYKVTKKQAERLKERITDRFLHKKRNPFLNEIEHEFFRIFQKDSKASVLRVRCQVCNYAQMRNKLQYSRHC